MVEVIDNLADFELIKSECNRLADKFRMPLLRYEWLKNSIDVFHTNDKLNIYVNRQNGHIKAIAPMITAKRSFSERLEIIGTSDHREPGGFLYEDTESLNELLSEVFKSKKRVFLKGLRAYSKESNVLRSTLRSNRAVPLGKTEYIPSIPIYGTKECFKKKISSSRRSSLKRLKRLAENEGKYSVEIFAPTLDNLDKYLEEIYQVESSGWKTRTKTALKLNSQLGKFFKNYCEDTIKEGILRFGFLRINGEAVAVQIGLIHSNRYWTLKIGYNEKYARCSPGILLMNEIIDYAFDNHLDAIELLGTNEVWLQIWPHDFMELITYRLYKSPISGFFDLSMGFYNSKINKIHTKFAKRNKPVEKLNSIQKLKTSVVRFFAKRHIAGAQLVDAVNVCKKASDRQWTSTISVWTSDNETKNSVAEKYKEILELIDKEKLSSYISIKPHSIDYDMKLFDLMISKLKDASIRIHIDSLFPETADKTLEFFRTAKKSYDNISYTLPSRWGRSIEDAEVMIDYHANVRIVKGQWIDPKNPHLDPRENYLRLVEKLAGKIPQLGIATHDKSLAPRAIELVKNSDTVFELEQFFSLPLISDKLSKNSKVNVRVYVPYGEPYMPYNIDQMKVRPAIILWMLRDLLHLN